jgi:hypothetical protein
MWGTTGVDVIDLEELKKLLADATPGTWIFGDQWDDDRSHNIYTEEKSVFYGDDYRLEFDNEADPALVVALRNSADDLIAELEAARHVVREADRVVHCPDISDPDPLLNALDAYDAATKKAAVNK